MAEFESFTHKVGAAYRITHDSGEGVEIFEGRFLGDSFLGHQFDRRPEFGTASVRDCDILHYEEV